MDKAVDTGDDTIQHRFDTRDQPVRGLERKVADGTWQAAPYCDCGVIGPLKDRRRPVAEADHPRDGTLQRRYPGRLQPLPASSHVGECCVERQADARPDLLGEITQ